MNKEKQKTKETLETEKEKDFYSEEEFFDRILKWKKIEFYSALSLANRRVKISEIKLKF